MQFSCLIDREEITFSQLKQLFSCLICGKIYISSRSCDSKKAYKLPISP